MPTIVTPEALYFGAPASLLIDGVEMGATLDNPKVNLEIEKYAPRFKNAGGPVAGAAVVKSVIPSLECMVNELSAAKIAHAMPGAVATVGTATETTAGADQILAAEVAAGATVIKFPGVAVATSAAADDIVDTATPHGFVLNQKVRFESITGGTGLTAATDYFVIAANLAASTLQISATQGGAAINFSADITAGVLIPAYAAGQFVRIGDGGETEIREIGTVGTSGSGGTGLTLTTSLTRAHDSGDQIRQVADAGTTVFTWTVGRVPSESFVTVQAIGLGLDGREMKVTLLNALAGDSFSFTMGDDDFYGAPLKFVGHYAAATPRVVPFTLEIA